MIADEVGAQLSQTFMLRIDSRDLRVTGRTAKLVGVPLREIVGPRGGAVLGASGFDRRAHDADAET